MLEFTVPLTQEITPLKHFLQQQGISLTLWRKIKRNGNILINNSLVIASLAIVHPGDIINISWATDCTIEPMALTLKICYEDDFLLIIDKPANLLVHPSRDANELTLANGVMNYFKETGQDLEFHPVHRLDRQTSGLVVIAKLPHVQHLLSRNNAKALQRIYLAIAAGHPSETGVINAPIGRSPDSIIERMVRSDGQPAITHYHVLESFPQASLLEIELLTGRTHQIRVHLAHIGHPLLGDDLYGGTKDLFSRQALHAGKLSFEHPIQKNFVEVSSPLPNDMVKLLSHLRKGQLP